MDSEIKNESESRLTFLKLKSENVSLEIIPEKGGRISRYCIKKDGETFELLMPINRSQPINGESFKNLCFPLIPFSNRIRKGHFSFQGQQIQLPLNFTPEAHAIHGHGWKMPWTVKKVSKQLALIEYRYFQNEWPFPYLAQQFFELNNSSLIITIKIKNIGKSSMPAGLGLHPYFLRTPNSKVTAKTKKMWINDTENMPLYLRTLPETKWLSEGMYVNQNALDNLFTGWNHEVRISWPEWKVNLNISSKDPLDYLMIYSPPHEDYFCVEPVSNITDAFNMMEKNFSGHGVKILKPGEVLEGEVCFTPEFY